MAGQEVDIEGIGGAQAAAADPGASIAFRAAVVAASRATDDAARRAALRDAAGAAISLAISGGSSELRSLLTPDPVNSNVTWSVACYQIGDLTPSAVRDFSDAAEAVATVSQCNDIGHVAAELVASTSMGIRWVALVRTNTTTQLRLPDAEATSDSTGKHASELGDAQRRWRRRIAAWAEGTDGIDLATTVDDPVVALPPADARSSADRREGPARGGEPVPDRAVAALREQLATIERQLARLDATITGSHSTDEERAGRLHAVLAEVEARLVDASLDTRSGLASVEHRLGDRVASVRDTLVRGLDATSTNAADTRDLVEARTSALAEQLRSGVRGLGEQLAATEARLADLTTGLLGVVERLDQLDATSRAQAELVRSAVGNDLAELARRIDAGHGVLDRRRQRDHEALAASVELLRHTSLDELRDAIAGAVAAGDASAERVLAAIAARADDTDAATELVLEVAAQQAATADRVLAAVAEVGAGTEAATELVLAAVGDPDEATTRILEAIGNRGEAATAALDQLLGAIAAGTTASGDASERLLAAIGETGAATDRVGAAVAEQGAHAAAAVERLVAAVADQRRRAEADVDALLSAIASRGDLADEAVERILTASAAQGTAAARATEEILAAIEQGADTELVLAALAQQGAATERVLLDLAEQGTATAEHVLAAVTAQATATSEQLLEAVATHGTAAERAARDILAALAEQGAESEQIRAAVVGQGASAEQLLAAIERVREAAAGGTAEVVAAVELAATQAAERDALARGDRRVEAAVEQLSLDLTDATRRAGSDVAEQQRRLTAALEEVRRELTNDMAITRGVVDGSVEGAAARIVRQLASQLEHVRVSTRSDLAAAVGALRDEEQRARDADARRRADDAGGAQADLLAAVERLTDRLDRLEASQHALRESLVGP